MYMAGKSAFLPSKEGHLLSAGEWHPSCLAPKKQARGLKRMCYDLIQKQSCNQTVCRTAEYGIRKNNGSKKRKRGQDHRIQVRWMHFNWIKGRFYPVWQKNGGGNCYSDMDPLTIEDTPKSPHPPPNELNLQFPYMVNTLA